MKAQVSVFIVVGLLFLVAIGLIMMITSLDNLPAEVEKQYIVKNSMEPVQLYVENCMELVADPMVSRLSSQGGSLNPQDFRMYKGGRYNYFCNNNFCSPVMRQDMEAELAGAIRINLSECIDLGVFRRQNFEVYEGAMDVHVTVGTDTVDVAVKYPVRLVREDFDMMTEDFSVIIRSRLGSLYEHSVDIANSERTNGYYDQVKSSYSVEKHRPYPDIVYNVTEEGEIFRFALQDGQNSYGCCHNPYDNLCFKDVPEYICDLKGGFYDPNPGCICSSKPESSCTHCSPCAATYDYITNDYTGPSRQHGESWCMYEAIAGKGYDYVGSRHYRHYCLDGVEYVEDCADFREEMCTSEIVDGHSQAMCRVNRWEDCSACQTEDCCIDTRYRDCDWKDWLNTEQKCVPYVPPGQRFWEYEDPITCGAASETKVCKGLSCPNIWVDDTAVLCYMQGDCGNYRNVAGSLAKGGFFNTDFSDQVRPYVYIDQKTSDPIELGIENRDKVEMIRDYSDELQSFVEMSNVAIEYFETMSSISMIDLINPMAKVEVIDISFCDVWQPGENQCSLCNEKMKECSEYRCRSLGEDCRYEELDGWPSCMEIHDADEIQPSVQIDIVGKQKQPRSLRAGDLLFDGYDAGDYYAYQLLLLNITTSEETICRAGYIPRLKYFNMPKFYLGEHEYSMQHNLSMRLPERLEIPETLYRALDATDLGQVLAALERPQEFLDGFMSRYSTEIRLVEAATGEDVEDMIKPYIEKATDLLESLSGEIPSYYELIEKLLASFEDGRYIIFIECTDREGNSNKDVFVSFGISDDVLLPELLGAKPENNSVSSMPAYATLYFNKPVDCFGFTCSSNPDSMRYGGSYTCRGYVNRTEDITCIEAGGDKRYNLMISRSEEDKAEGLYANLTGSDIYVPASYINNARFYTKENVTLHLYMDELLSCSLEDDMQCIDSDNLYGLYECVAEVPNEQAPRTLNITLLNGPYTPVDGVNIESPYMHINFSIVPDPLVVSINDRVNTVLDLKDYTCTVLNQDTGVVSEMDCTDNCRRQLFAGQSYAIECTSDEFEMHEILCKTGQTRHNLSFSLSYTEAPGLEITDFGPQGEVDWPEIYAVTNHGAVCGYYKDISLAKIRMQNVSNRHSAVAESGSYTIECSDEYGNVASAGVSFYVAE